MPVCELVAKLCGRMAETECLASAIEGHPSEVERGVVTLNLSAL
jgi:hypothetical protein